MILFENVTVYLLKLETIVSYITFFFIITESNAYYSTASLTILIDEFEFSSKYLIFHLDLTL